MNSNSQAQKDGAIFYIKPPKFLKEQVELAKNESKITDKSKPFKLNQNPSYKRASQSKIPQTTVKTEFLRESLSKNPKYRPLLPKDHHSLKGSFKTLYGTLKPITKENMSQTQSQKLFELEMQLQKELNKNVVSTIETKPNEEVDIIADLQGTKGLSKYDCWEEDLKPQDWEAICKETSELTHAKCPMFKNGKYIWVDVQVLSFDCEKNRFTVRVTNSDKELVKSVSRLSIYFKKENLSKFRERISQCKMYQQKAEEEMRFIRFTEAVNSEYVRPLPEFFFQGIFKRVFLLKIHKFDMFKEQAIFSEMMRIVHAEYLREMKKCFVLDEMQDPTKKNFFEEKKIYYVEQPKVRWEYKTNLHSDLKGSFKERLAALKSKVIIKNKKTESTVRLFQEKSYDFKHTCLYDLKALEKKMPFSLKDFVQLQKEFFDRNKESLRIQWREYLLGDICDIIRNVPQFNTALSDINDYKKPGRNSLERLLHRIDFSFRYFLIELFNFNCDYFCNFLKRFTLPDEEEENPWSISERPLFQVTMKYIDPESGKRGNDDKDKEKEKEKNRDKRHKEEALIYYEPSQKQFLESLSEPIRWIANFVSSIDCLEGDVTRIQGTPMYKLVSFKDEVVKRVTDNIQSMLKKGFEEPNEVMNGFKPFMYLLDKSKDDIVKNIFDKCKKTGSMSHLDEYLQKLCQSINDLDGLYCNEHKGVFFQIKTSELKEHLMSKANEIKLELLRQVSSEVNKNIASIRDRYQNLREEMIRVPEKEEDLINLNKVLNDCDNQLALLDNQTAETYNYILLMEKYGEKFEDDSMIGFWLLKVCPLEVRISFNDGKKIAGQQEQVFLAYLEENKRVFETDLSLYKMQFDELKRFDDFKKINEIAKKSEELGSKLDNACKRLADFNRRENLFGIVACRYESLEKLLDEFAPYRQMWETAFIFDSSRENWMTSPVIKLNHKKVVQEIDKHKKSLLSLIRRFEEDGSSEALKVCNEVREEIKEFEKNLPLLEFLTKDCMVKKPNNWKYLFNTINVSSNQQTDTLHWLLNNNVSEKIEAIEEYVTRSEKEYLMEIKLQKEIIEKLKTVKLTLLPHKQTDSFILTGVDELQTMMDDFFNVLMMMKQSPYIGLMKKKVEEIEKKLIGIQDLMVEWIKCQRTWIYLSPIFASEDLKKKMPVEKKMFDGVDKSWQTIMQGVSEDPLIFENFDWEKTKAECESNNKILDQIQKSLSDYLEAKREEFPRFYFLSDEELIEIISKTKDPSCVAKYLGKCFEGIDSIEFTPDGESIISMISAEKEVITLDNKIKINEGEKRGNVEKWLGELEDNMRLTLQKIAWKSYESQEPREEWIIKWPGQIILAIDCVKWTMGVEMAITNGTLSQFQQKCNQELSQIVNLVRNELTSLERINLSALIVIEVHAKYVMEELIKKNIRSVTDFEWMSQFRYYMTEKRLLQTAVLSSEYDYQYEYLGNTPRLVITPLTDRCYRTLMSAYQFFYGGAPEGPAGTGKTETVKDLAKAVAVQCNVFNCTDQINYVAMSKFFKGLSQTGSWCCFDEFNRIQTEVLSVIAEQVRTIQTAIKEGRNKFFFEGKNMKLVKSCAINITMNPGYAGRSELPDNLKALFRSCAMMIPDYILIAEIMLYSSGFQTANSLATKIVGALRLSSEQLSSQKHYDFGMRALKAILVAAANLKKQASNVNEATLCLKALKDVNIPKFTLEDVPLFNSIISDLFPGVEQAENNNQSLVDSLIESCKDLSIIPKDNFITKAIQLYDTMNVRHGLIVVGETFSGKTKCISALQKGLEKNGIPVEKYVINPKAITAAQLYGNLDQNTKIWTDGIIPNVMKICEDDADKPERKWITFDGPVDAVWIENMNTVLDDNKVLCLTNGQKIKLTNWMTMLFEVEDLFNASPATVSRCGMIFMEPDQLYWNTLIDAYLTFELSEELGNLRESFRFNLEWFLGAILSFIDKHCKLPVTMNKLQLTENCLITLRMLLLEIKTIHGFESAFKEIENKCVDLCLYAVLWGVGGIFDEVYRSEVNIFLLKLIYFEDVRTSYKLEIDNQKWEPRGLSIQIKDSKNLFAMKFDIEKMVWIEWSARKFEFSKDRNLRFDELIIPTPDSVRLSHFIKSMIGNQRHIMLVGPTGTGKTIGIMNEINETFNRKDIGNIISNFSGQTQVNMVQTQIESKMTTRKGKKGYFGPEDSKTQMVIFIDDVNMPTKEIYGAQSPIELLRMMLDHSFWYDLETLEPKYLVNLNFAVSMGPPSTGRNTVTSRFARHFFVHYTCPYDNNSLKLIFSSILEWQFQSASPKYLPSVVAMKDTIVNSTLDLFQKIKNSKELLPTPQKSHYIFSIRDISRVFQTISKATYRSFKSEEDMVKLWAHECSRVFQDRLINENDQQVFSGILRHVIKTSYKNDWNKLVKSEPLLFADFIPMSFFDKDGQQKTVTGIYCELSDKQHLKTVFQKLMADYNEYHTDNKLNLVLFMEAIEHVVKIVRVITTTNGHCLLVGLGGLGRKTLTVLSTFIAGYDLSSFELSNTFSKKEWSEKLQSVLKSAGVEGKKTVFVLKDNQIFNEDQLEDISSILTRGEIPGLFPNDERIKIIEEVTNFYGNEPGVITMTNAEKFEYFVKKCKDNLHLSLCFSPVGESFRQRLRCFPSFINCTTIDWFLEWPKEAFQSVAQTLLKEEEFSASDLSAICATCVEMHDTVSKLANRFYHELKRHYYVTPSNYFELINLFKKILNSRNFETDSNIQRYVKGVATLEDSKEKVEEMKKAIIELEPKLKQANIETEELIKTIEVEKIDANEKRAHCEKEELLCSKDREQAQELKQYCREELDKVEPLLDAAAKNLKSIQRAHIDFIKTIKNPLPPIQKLFQALCILFKVKNIPMVKDPADPYKKKPDWATPARNIVMAKPDQMLNFMMAMDSEEINKMNVGVIDALKELQSDPFFNIEAINNVSQAASKIASFINTVVEIFDKLQIINPKREALKEAEEKLERAETSLAATKDELTQIMNKISSLEQQFEDAKTKKENLESEIQRCKKQLISAEKLVSGLESEKVSWTKNIQDLQISKQSILSDVLLSAAIIAYLGIFPIDYRESALSNWKTFMESKNLKVSAHYELKTVLSNDIVIGNWTNKFKLPNDSYSIDNAIMIFNSSKFPIIIDPQNQANRWIKMMEKDNNLVVLKPNSRSVEIQNSIANSIEYGFPVLFENAVEELNVNVMMILENKRKKLGKNIMLKFMDKWTTMHENFRFYITTKLSKPHFGPDICVLSNILNFQVTTLGLEDQLLNILVSKEDPNSEKARINNVKEFYELKKKQKITEENILSLLTSNTGNLLDDVTLIETLQKSKSDAKDAAIRLVDIETMKKKLQNTRNFYKKAANRASQLFFCVNDLGILEPMYQFSLDWFIELYQAAINEEPKVKETRVNDIINIFTRLLFNRVAPSLFEKDKLLFAFLIFIKTLQCEDLTTDAHVRKLFVGCNATIPKTINTLPGIFSDKQWAQFEELEESFPVFKDLAQNLLTFKPHFSHIMNDANPHLCEIPVRVAKGMSDIDFLLLFKVLRPDKFLLAVQNRISAKFGHEFVDYQTFNLENIYKNSKNSTPIIFILSPGSDPLNDIIKLSIQLGKNKNVDVLSLGQGQEVIALKLLELAQSKGRWVVLQNCHLAPRILSLIEKSLDENQHQDFRLWLTSMPSDKFPVSLLQNGIKITNEPPRGIKSNMIKNLSQFGPKFIDHIKSYEWQKLLFGLTFFHSIVQERRKYGSLGWNIPYEFSQNDYIISTTQLNQVLKDFEDVPWKTIKYIIAEANYGGRVTDPQDRRLINVILSQYISKNVLDENYKFSSNLYIHPPDSDLNSWINFIKSNYPLNDPPEIFGLHENAEITSGINQTNELMASLLNLLPRTNNAAGMSNDEIVMQQCQHILAQFCNPFNIEEIQKKFPISYENSMNTVLLQELIKYNKLTEKISSSLKQLVKAIEGFVMMSEELDEIYNKMLNNKVPDAWHVYAYPSVKPLSSWVINLGERLKFMQDWVDNGQPSIFWISGFFFTQSFLTGILQNYARAVNSLEKNSS